MRNDPMYLDYEKISLFFSVQTVRWTPLKVNEEIPSNKNENKKWRNPKTLFFAISKLD